MKQISTSESKTLAHVNLSRSACWLARETSGWSSAEGRRLLPSFHLRVTLSGGKYFISACVTSTSLYTSSKNWARGEGQAGRGAGGGGVKRPVVGGSSGRKAPSEERGVAT